MPIILPTLAPALTPQEAGQIAARGRVLLLRKGELTHHQHSLLDVLLWSCQRRGGVVEASYSRLADLAHMARDTIADGLRAFERLGLLARIKRAVRIVQPHGGVVTRQLTSRYVLQKPAPRLESTPPTVPQNQSLFLASAIPAPARAEAAAALEKIRRAREEERAAAWAARRAAK